MPYQLEIPVVFIIFNRPDATRKSFESIRRARPKQLFVIADGPRLHKPDDKSLCAETRAIVDKIDWDCELLRNYAEENMGCKERIISGLTWVFDQAEQAIIVEDDCIPHLTFYQFCQELLHRYKDDEDIAIISGSGYPPKRKDIEGSYYLSKFPHIWGWATWRRIWEKYESNLSSWPDSKQAIQEFLGDALCYAPHIKRFEEAYVNQDDLMWDYMLVYSLYKNKGYSIAPRCNMVTNIGFALDALHTKNIFSRESRRPVYPMPFPLTHPTALEFKIEKDQKEHVYLSRDFWGKFGHKVYAVYRHIADNPWWFVYRVLIWPIRIARKAGILPKKATR